MASDAGSGRSSFTWLVWLAGAMFAGSMLAAYVPLAVRLSASKTRIMSLFGCGLLVGVALIVVIPEGVSVVMSASAESAHLASNHQPLGKPPSAIASGSQTDHEEHHEEEESAATIVGVSLAAGFILQLIVDQISSSHAGHSHGHTMGKKNGGHYRQLPSEGYEETGEVALEIHSDPDFLGAPKTASVSREDQLHKRDTSFGAFIGLLVHAAADGIALGASSLSDSSSLGAVVFLAVMLHKMPAAFGLTSFFMAAGVTRPKTSAPLAAMLTYGVVKLGLVKGDSKESIGALLLFSGGATLGLLLTLYI